MTTLQATADASPVTTAEALRRARTILVGATYWLGLAAGWVLAATVVAAPIARLRAGSVGATYWLGLAAGWVRARVATYRLRTQREESHEHQPRSRAARLTRRGTRGMAWLVILCGVGTFGASLAVPAWYGLHGQRLLIVTSGSMSPFVEAGGAVVLQAIDDPSQLRVGQVASFWPPGGDHLVTHRIVDLRMFAAMEPDPTTGSMVPLHDAAGRVVERPFILTKGDANATNDPNATPLSRVRGVVVGTHANWGFALNWASSARGRMIMLVPPLVLLAALELIDSLSERRRRPKARPTPRPQEDRFDAYLLT